MTLGSWVDRWPKADAEERISLLSHLSKEEISRGAHFAPPLLKEEKQLVVAVQLIRAFGNHWPEEYLGELLSRLESPSVLEGRAALEALIERAPESLREQLPKLLNSQDPVTKALAIKGLARIDVPEAIAHFEAMLGVTVPEFRREALKAAFFLPFDQVKPLLLNHLARESDFTIFEDGLLLLAINPDPEVPYRLYELAESASSERRELLQATIKEACKSLKASGLLEGDFPDAMNRLQTWIKKRRAIRFVRQCLVALAEGNPENPPPTELATSVQHSLQQPEIAEAFQAVMKSRLPEALRNRLSRVMGTDNTTASVFPEPSSKPVSESTPPPEPPDPEKIREMKIRDIAALAFTGRELPAGEVTKILEATLDSPDHELIATAIRTATRLENGGLVQKVIPWLSRESPEITGSAIEYLARFSPDEVFPRLGNFLASRHSRVKRAAIEALRQSDPGQAMSRLRVILFDKAPEQQELALGCFVQFEFSLVRSLLGEYLRSGPDSRLFTTGLDLFQAFPETENLEILFDLSRNCRADRVRQVEEAIEAIEKRLCEISVLKSDQLPAMRADREKRWKERETRMKAPPPPYSIRARKPSSSNDWSQLFQNMKGSPNFQNVFGASLIGFILVFGVAWLLQEPGEREMTKSSGALFQKQVGFFGKLVTLEGEVQETRAMVRSENGTLWCLIDQGSTRLRDIPEGGRTFFLVTPFRIAPAGVILGNLISCSVGNER